MARKFSKKQLAAQRKFAAMAKRRAKASRKSKSKRRVVRRVIRRARVVRKARKVKNMARKKGGFRRRMNKLNAWGIATKLADANAVIQIAEPVVRQTLPAAMNGDVQGAMQGAKQGIKEAVAPRNLAEAFVPSMTVRAARKVVSWVKRI